MQGLLYHDEASEKGGRLGSARSTYTEVGSASFGNFLGEDSKEIQYASVALGLFAQGGDDEGQNVLPLQHLNRQDSQAHA